ncbi:hypothetical protein AXK58_16495 [Tsukamurella tyrosinosolvens]|uniref:Uncharacterized protein n=1 Tax=Tsukamurella tyrosinosolvens TaxID=57704 RepID=A0A1H4SM44_TSUTY|nr:hypothetical protein [Tsukamurella tyrosinosolvens]KXO93429.1 hypothetical protein AXK58_16495 [Tsukamurella tyrosinosolvens]SEC45179.1 hypothetical protein SAMN04489793_2327 [Tsukamurella tyrosinosolvens]
MALIVAAIATAFIDAIPVEVTIGLCALGVIAGLVGVPLYIAHLLAGWRSPQSSKAATGSVADAAPVDTGTAEPAASAVVEPDSAQARPEPEPEPEPESEPEPEPDVEAEAEPEPQAEPEPAAIEGEGDETREASAEPPPARCSCHGLPVSG